jgi:hypothetical protein
MLKQMEQRNRELWSGHPTMLEDIAHVAGGIGLGLMFASLLTERQARPTAWMLILASAGIHAYADMVKPSGAMSRRSKRRGRKRGGLAEMMTGRLAR